MTIAINGVDRHAEFYPLLDQDALQVLADDIKDNGQRDPITVTEDGILVDGRNRLAACKIAGVEPKYEIFEGDDIGAFVRSKNERRHQSTGSRAMSTALSLASDGYRENGRWKRGSLDNGGSAISGWSHRMKEAGLIIDELPELAEDVVSGDISLDEAFKLAKSARDDREAEEQARAAFEEQRIRAEQEAREFFQANKLAANWYADQPSGKFDTWQITKQAYLEHDRQARWEEEKARLAQEAVQKETKERIERHARYLEAFVNNFFIGLDMMDDPEREEVLTAAPKRIADKFKAIENACLRPMGEPQCEELRDLLGC
ncbi:ParB N-terminal domain-containing protein [Corynebacterium ulceribovis]|uniref:ParB N-terminal domain-containing protein n=1 Tax=Corynebacterium ulceribovis TaxID=487732 RepID=UPI000368056D|nr:ParB/RepB/Spo0J family partition protein [Corynebacterium ulceribovis]